ncbi:MAG: hypothetical protein WCY59_05850 [Anaerovoracaceae bacterium]
MNPMVFVARSWGNTRLHEGQVYFIPDKDSPSGWECFFDRADSSPYSRFMGISGKPGPASHPNYEYENCIKKLSGPLANTRKRFGVDLFVIYMDDITVCPFCGDIGGVLRDFKDNDDRAEQWDRLRRTTGGPVSYGDIAVAQAVANKNKHTRPFLYRMCDECRKHWQRPLLSGVAPERSHWKSLPYEIVSSKISDDKERNAWWETKLICHGRKLPKIAFPCVKKAIARRLRRKSLSKQEHEYLSMMMSASSIKRLLA